LLVIGEDYVVYVGKEYTYFRVKFLLTHLIALNTSRARRPCQQITSQKESRRADKNKKIKKYALLKQVSAAHSQETHTHS
jgi:hypothetical protein